MECSKHFVPKSCKIKMRWRNKAAERSFNAIENNFLSKKKISEKIKMQITKK